ncbi:aminoglycoside 3'-phosphotransferase [Paenibacillus alkalitolerans]|uniref:aminoglycoside 3'-phosphotransferase n=1 Tax=Paenibacillus alkalitolerans TaxID=2799335 RepID=UPI0018F5594B|nr:aminoglycoside 3'-phosphotransferase [Paenibacillus alkalitolerans]
MEENVNHELPPEFINKFSEDQITLCWENLARTYFIQSRNGTNKYLKIQPVGSIESIEVQAQKLLWLKGKLSVPEVVDKGILGNYEYLLTLEIKGAPASDKCFQNDVDGVVKLVAQGLRTIHEVPIANCSFDNRLNNLMEMIRYNYMHGHINALKLNRNFGIENIDALLVDVEAFARKHKEDLVFTHGDYSMPNIMISDGRISGFIDLGNCGISDRYYDLAVAEKSIVLNYGSEFIDMFYKYYGMNGVDRQRIRFFQIIECLLWG